MSNQNSDSSPATAQAYHRRNFWWCLTHIVLAPLLLLWIRTRAVGRENIDNTRGGLFLINHQSFLDPLIAAVRLRRPVSYLARDSLFRIPFIGFILRNTYVTPISRTAFRGSSVRTALDRMEQGFLVGVFPEGTRSSGIELKDFRPGFLALARRCNVPVYPVAIQGADKALPRGAWFIRPASVTVTYGPALTADEMQRLQSDEDDRQLAGFIQQKVAALLTQNQDTVVDRLTDNS
jgi:1-acyl-sn-glycerol-3-phosphate acyltransferase